MSSNVPPPSAPPAGGWQPPVQSPRRRPATVAVVGLALGLLGVVVKLTVSSSQTVNGTVTECTSFDLGPFVIAAICLGCGIAAFRSRGEHMRDKGLDTALAGVVLLLAAAHTVRGVLIAAGVLGPCS